MNTLFSQLDERVLYRLWPSAAPGARGTGPEDIPTLQAVLPAAHTASAAACIVCPGGGYVMLAEHEGVPVAQWLASQGITAFILRYRHAFTYQHPIPLGDALRAVRFVRAHARTWQLDPERIGMIGFSAGGHLTSLVATHDPVGHIESEDPIERIPAHLNAHVLVYPVIHSADNSVLENIQDAHLSPEQVADLKSDRRVTARTSPAFLVHSTQDRGVPVDNSDAYAARLQAAGVPYEYIRTDQQEHGFGLQDFWTHACARWFQNLGWSSTAPAQAQDRVCARRET
ncbi:alpha/beta hydrolase [Dictyobacter kobayashii]|uniref:Endo-1,4-beta-xylanase n=1 Tax=Dictyobacter kobayashii TaxID=2014872 RepID=A0A402ASS4_9CHLR|nr:alpha/beta hydrolase [Dictyobacter kobayashii]GCE22160.1 endo-1,4-beta-xylanase [Dictyobacter kobayashii]